jgi:phage terminase large subunit-like protein
LLKNYLSPQAYRSLQEEKAKRLISRKTPKPYIGDDPSEFIQREMVIPETGNPLILHPEQSTVLQAMAHRTNNAFDYSTWLYSAPKKSGKTTIGAGVALWQAWRVPDGAIYIIGNDQKQADNRMMEAIRYAINHNERLSRHARIVRYSVYLDNGTKIESIPVDPRGEAGMNPTGLFWTETWGAIGNRPEMLWTEASLSPTRAGDAIKFVESYAGFSGESLILERLHDSIIKQGKPHESIPELYTNGQSIG